MAHEEKPQPKGDVPGEWYSPTQPIPSKPPAFDRQGLTIDDLIDFTPELRAEAKKLVSKYKIGPLFTPPVVSKVEGPLGKIQVPGNLGGANWPGGSYDPETHIVYVYSQTSPTVLGLIPLLIRQTQVCGTSWGTQRRRQGEAVVEAAETEVRA